MGKIGAAQGKNHFNEKNMLVVMKNKLQACKKVNIYWINGLWTSYSIFGLGA